MENTLRLAYETTHDELAVYTAFENLVHVFGYDSVLVVLPASWEPHNVDPSRYFWPTRSGNGVNVIYSSQDTVELKVRFCTHFSVQLRRV